MSDLRRPWFVLTKTGAVVPPVLEIVIGGLGGVVQLIALLQGEPASAQSAFVWVIAPLLVAQGVADLTWWSRHDRRRRVRDRDAGGPPRA